MNDSPAKVPAGLTQADPSLSILGPSSLSAAAIEAWYTKGSHGTGNLAADAANYPCPPTSAQVAAGVSCVIAADRVPEAVRGLHAAFGLSGAGTIKAEDPFSDPR